MKDLFVDDINWIVYSKDAKGDLWVTDYPQSEMHGGGPARMRKVEAPVFLLTQLEQLLGVLERRRNELRSQPKLVGNHLAAIGEVVFAFASGQEIAPRLSTAVRTFGWSFLPNQWGSEVESAWAAFAEVAKNVP